MQVKIKMVKVMIFPIRSEHSPSTALPAGIMFSGLNTTALVSLIIRGSPPAQGSCGQTHRRHC